MAEADEFAVDAAIACGCLIKNVGGRCGVSVAFERSGWLAPSVPVALLGVG